MAARSTLGSDKGWVVSAPHDNNKDGNATQRKGNNLMPKGHHAYEPDIDFTLAQFCARIEERILLFAAETGTRADRVAERLSALLSPQGQGFPDHLPPMREEAPRIHRTVEPLALAEHARGGGPPITVEAEPGPRKTGSGSYWDKMTPKQRTKEMARRKAKWSAEALSRWVGGKPKKSSKNASKTETAKSAKPAKLSKKEAAAEEAARQLRFTYRQRHLARVEGKPLPPLPPAPRSKSVKSDNLDKLELRRKKDRESKAKSRAAAKAAEAKAGKKSKANPEKVAKQRRYQDRSDARKAGLPLPPLPGQDASGREAPQTEAA